MELRSNLSLAGGAALLTWSYLVMQRSADTVAMGRAASPVAGDVLAYTLGGVTRYRLIPDSGLPTQDAFYSDFSAGACTGLIAARG